MFAFVYLTTGLMGLLAGLALVAYALMRIDNIWHARRVKAQRCLLAGGLIAVASLAVILLSPALRLLLS